MSLNKKILIRVISFLILFPILIYILIYISNKQSISENFNGVVKEINYDGHGNPRVKLNDNNFINLLLFSLDSSPKSIKVGDSLNKKKGDSILFHYKKDKKGVYYLFNQYTH